MSYTTIKGAEQHSPTEQAHVDRAVEVLFGEFHDQASPEKTRAIMGDPASALLVCDQAIAIVTEAGTVRQKLWRMWVNHDERGEGIGGKLLDHIIEAYTAPDLHLRLDCPVEREGFYSRHGFVSFCSRREGAYVDMAGPAKNRGEVAHLYPVFLR